MDKKLFLKQINRIYSFFFKKKNTSIFVISFQSIDFLFIFAEKKANLINYRKYQMRLNLVIIYSR